MQVYFNGLKLDPFRTTIKSHSVLTRDKRIYLYRQRKSGVTLKQLSQELGVSPERVRQVQRTINRRINWIKKLKQNFYNQSV